MRILGELRRALGAQRLCLGAPCVRELLGALVERGGDALAARFYADPAAAAPTASRDLRVLVNGRSIRFLEGLETPLREGDAVTVYLSGVRGYPGG